MGRWLASFACAVLVSLSPAAARAQFEATTECGVTVTPQEIVDCLFESQAFWPGVRKHIVSKNFPVGDLSDRQQAVEILAEVDNHVTRCVTSSDEAKVQDVLDFFSARLRKFAIYREIRTLVANDAQFCRLKDVWEDGRYLLNLDSVEGHVEAKSKLLDQMKIEMSGLPEEKVKKAIDAWKRLGDTMDRSNNTDVGKMLVKYEAQMINGDAEMRDLMRNIVRAADWAHITRTSPKSAVKTADFVTAWDHCMRNDVAQTARKN